MRCLRRGHARDARLSTRIVRLRRSHPDPHRKWKRPYHTNVAPLRMRTQAEAVRRVERRVARAIVVCSDPIRRVLRPTIAHRSPSPAQARPAAGAIPPNAPSRPRSDQPELSVVGAAGQEVRRTEDRAEEVKPAAGTHISRGRPGPPAVAIGTSTRQDEGGVVNGGPTRARALVAATQAASARPMGRIARCCVDLGPQRRWEHVERAAHQGK